MECTVGSGTLGPVDPSALLNDFRTRCDARLEELLPTESHPPTELHQAMRYSALAPGKRLRPLFVMSAAFSVGANPEVGLDAGCAAELVHCFSLIHDDLPAIDNDALRRGRPTCHVKFGEGLALLAGDALFALAFQVLTRSKGSPEAILRCLALLSEASGSDGLVGGEVADVLAEGQPVSAEQLQFIHARKTGSLIAASCAMGALLGDGAPSEVEAVQEYGRLVGLAFQIADDILNETSTAEQLGKAAGSDRERNKATYPALYGLESAQVRAQEICQQASELALSHLRKPELLVELARLAVDRQM